jgi:hypothetical protein
MNAEQKALLDEIEAMKRTPGHDKRALNSLVRRMCSFDDREGDLRSGRCSDPGGRSRSPSFGRWNNDDADL